jgi:hypothetical protein
MKLDQLPPELLLMIFEKTDEFDIQFTAMCSRYFFNLSRFVNIKPGKISKIEEEVDLFKQGYTEVLHSDQIECSEKISESNKYLQRYIRDITFSSSFSRYKLAPKLLQFNNNEKKEWFCTTIDISTQSGFFNTLQDITNCCKICRDRIKNGPPMKYQPMHNAVASGNSDVIRLLCYLGFPIGKYHLKIAAQNDNIDVMRFIMEPGICDIDEWLKSKNITFSGRKDVLRLFNPDSVKIKKYMKTFYDIVLVNDNPELYSFLTSEKIETPNGVEDLFVNSPKNGSRLFHYLLERHREIIHQGLLRECIKSCIRHDNLEVLNHLIDHCDCFADLTISERDQKLFYFLSTISFVGDEDRPQIKIYRLLFNMVSDQNVLSGVVLG